MVYLTAEIEEGNIIAQGNAPLREDGSFVRDRVKARLDADFPVVAPEEVQLMDVPSVSIVPFSTR